MIFTFCDEAGEERLEIKGELFKYLIKVRRHHIGDQIAMRTKHTPQMLYIYEVVSIDARSVLLHRLECREEVIKASSFLHLGWCLIDPKSIEKVLPMLNEIGVSKITFITCKRSQKQFKPDFKRFDRILEASSQQCGRSENMQFDTCESLSRFLEHYPDAAVLDFVNETFGNAKPQTLIVGCEGGFDEQERQLFQNQMRYRFDTPLVLRSESAVVVASSKILL